MKPIQRSELQANQRIRIYFKSGTYDPWGYIEGKVWGGNPRTLQVEVTGEKLPYETDASNIGHTEMIYPGDLIFLLEDGE